MDDVNDAYRSIRLLWGLFVVAAVARLALAHTVAGPYIFTDELHFADTARSFPNPRGLLWDGTPAYLPCWLYPVLISPFLKFLSWEAAFSAVRALNAALAAATVFPAYGLARELGSRRAALAAAGLVALLPAAGYSASIMTESLFLPVFTLALYLIFRAVRVPTAGRRLLAGLACGLGFHVKPHGLVLPVIVAVTVLAFETGNGHASFAAWLRAVGRHWLTALGWLIAMAPRLAEVAWMERPGEPLSMAAILGGYSDTAAGHRRYAALEMLPSWGAYLAAWAWCVGLLPVFALARCSLAALRGVLQKTGPLGRIFRPNGEDERRLTDDEPARLLTTLTLAAAAVLLTLTVRHTLVNGTLWKLHERYFFVTLPPALVLFAVRGAPPAAGLVAGWTRALTVALLGVLGAVAVQKLGLQLPNNAPSLTGTLLPGRVGGWMVVLWLLPAAAGLGMFIVSPGGAARQGWIVALLFISGNIGWYGFHGLLLSRWSADMLNAAAAIDQRLAPGDRLLVLADRMDPGLAWRVDIRNPGPSVSFLPPGAGRSWFSQDLKLNGAGEVVVPAGGGNAWLLASNRWRMSRVPELGLADCALFDLGAGVPLRFDPAQVARFRRAPGEAAPFSERTLLDDLNVKVVEARAPESVSAGQRFEVALKVRNENAFAWPAGSLGVGFGCRWAGVEDRSRPVRVGRWIGPGEVMDLVLNATAPRVESGLLTLEVRPAVMTGQGRRQGTTWREAAVWAAPLRVVEQK